MEDKDGNLYSFATNKNYFTLTVSPNKIGDKKELAKVLSGAIGESEEDLTKKLENNTLWQVIKKKLSDEEAAALQSLDIPELSLSEEIFRYYPHDLLASHVIGFLGGEGAGQYGVEGYYDEILRGEEILEEKEKGAFGYFDFSEDERKETEASVILTLDYNIQFKAEKLLQEAAEKWKIEQGSIIVMDPKDGAILAMANYPFFDPNNYGEVQDGGVFLNPAIQKIFEPGSIFKPATMAAALNEKKITPETKYVDQGFLQIGGFTIYNYAHKVWGEKTMTEVLEQSINTGAVFAERQLGNNSFLQYIEKFGFFEPTGIDLQGEIFFQNPELKKGYEVNFATASFGQGIAVTPIQIARFFGAVANGGELVTPHVTKKIVKQSGEEINFEPRKIRVMEERTSSLVRAMMVSVVKQGIAKRAQIPGYFVAGKTGTAQVPFPDKLGYYPDLTIQTFVGFAPAFDPKFLVLIKLDKPIGAAEASASALPIFRDLAQYIIDYLEIPPDHQEE